MRVRLEDPADLTHVADYLKALGCRVSFSRECVLEVSFEPTAATDDRDPLWLERIRLEAYLRTWNALHPTTKAVMADSTQTAA